MDFVSLILQLIGGLIGSNGTGKAAPALNLGTLGNIVTGVIGGFGGGALVGNWMTPAVVDAATTAATSGNWGAILGQFVGGGVGGAVLTVIAGAVRNMMNKS